MATWRVPAYRDTLSDALIDALKPAQDAVTGVPGLTVDRALLAAHAALQTPDALAMVIEIYEQVADALGAALTQRQVDRAFIDATTREHLAHNATIDLHSPAYRTVIGATDATGRVLVGPLPTPAPTPRVTLPAFLAGPAVTLFGPPDDEKMCVNAMNALHRRRADEAEIVADLVAKAGFVPFWGADSEDSKTPFIGDLLAATHNLAGCYDRSLDYTDPRSGKRYQLAADGLSVPIKRVPGIALPAGTHLYQGEPLPMHLLDLVLHAHQNFARPEAMVFYVPKLENEEEAHYFATLIRATEAAVKRRNPAFPLGTTRLFIVFETPRAIFRIQEVAAALHPFFAGGSLGWHDFLAATARLFKHDPNYRIPVKADPNIVIHHIKESHVRLANALGPLGAIKIGGMYGTLFADGDADSFQVSMVGYIKDVITQLRRGLDGFWVAHPDFVRIGVALVSAWHRRTHDPGALDALVAALVPDEVELKPLRAFLEGPDVAGLSESDPLYLRRVLAADITHSDVIANDDPEEVRYNVFQALQYLAAWLTGTGCVALPATLKNQRGEHVFVRVMDDLATTERSRWEVWAEIHHGRVSVAQFDEILAAEIAFLQAGVDQPLKRVQVHWQGEAARWYPIAVRLLRQLVTSERPVEAVPELALPFTLAPVRDAPDPWAAAVKLCPGRYEG